MTAKE